MPRQSTEIIVPTNVAQQQEVIVIQYIRIDALITSIRT